MEVQTIDVLTQIFARNPMAAVTVVVLLAAGSAMGAGWGFLKLRVKTNDSRDTQRDRNILALTQVGFETLGKVTEVVRSNDASMTRQNDSNLAVSSSLQQVATSLENLVNQQKQQSEVLKAFERRIARLEIVPQPRKSNRKAA